MTRVNDSVGKPSFGFNGKENCLMLILASKKLVCLFVWRQLKVDTSVHLSAEKINYKRMFIEKYLSRRMHKDSDSGTH